LCLALRHRIPKEFGFALSKNPKNKIGASSVIRPIFISTIAFFVAALIAGCSTPLKEINAGRAKLLPDTVSVVGSTRGDFIVEFDGFGRFHGEIYISDCKNGNGDIRFIGVQNGSFVSNLLRNGSTPTDRLFDEVCSYIVRVAAENERDEKRKRTNLAPEQRAQERRGSSESDNSSLLRLMIQQQMMQDASSAADTRNRELIDATKPQPSQTNCTRDGWGNVRCTTR
jgi:hypothetical protein